MTVGEVGDNGSWCGYRSRIRVQEDVIGVRHDEVERCRSALTPTLSRWERGFCKVLHGPCKCGGVM